MPILPRRWKKSNMKYITQFLYILLFSLLGEVMSRVIPLPIPAAIYGLILLLLALCLRIVKVEKVSDVSKFLLEIMPILFVPPAVNILANWGIISPHLVSILVVILVSTFLVFAVSGLVTSFLLKRKEKDND